MLYGRLPGYHLSELGQQMAQRIADAVGDRDITHVVASPLERAQETARPLALARGVDIVTDARVIESTNIFEGRRFSVGDGDRQASRRPGAHLWNPFRPSWGEPYKAVVARMMAAVYDARDSARGHEAVRRLPPAADLDHPAARREPVLPAQPAQPAVHAVQPDVAGLRRRRPGHAALLRAGRRPDPGQGPQGRVLRPAAPTTAEAAPPA